MTWTMLSVLLIALAFLYCGALVLVCVGLFRLKPGRNLQQYAASVVVAARNEAEHIAACLRALLAQTYPAQKVEIVVVDDRSEDETASIVRSFASRHDRIRLVSITDVPPGVSPKKHAVEAGVVRSQGEIVLTTDADSIPGPRWIEALVGLFEPEVGAAVGVVELNVARSPNPIRGLQALELLSYSVFTAGAIGVGWAINSNAGSFAYRRRAFEEVGGLRGTSNVVSGDDVLFLQCVSAQTPWEVGFAFAEESFVKTAGAETLKDFWHQRLRWASKCTRYRARDQVFLCATFLFFLLLGTMLPTSVAGWGDWRIPLLCWAAKVLFEFAVLAKGCFLFHRVSLLKYFPLAAVVHIPYILIAAGLGTFFGFEWKGRRYGPSTLFSAARRESYGDQAAAKDA